ncbi:MAG: trypsin-like peptidase domain-containing protein [Deltaproteobacteria bacterium]|nr:trypsin-like peptidase domain-containing protein [Deltaproteobacteria bacterium]
MFPVAALAALLGVTIFLGVDEPCAQEATNQQAPRTESEQQIIDAYRRTNATVVYVTTKTVGVDFWGPVAQEGSGSGVIIDAERALVITNAHVVGKAQQVEVTLANGLSYAVKVIGLDPDIDLALLRIEKPPADLVAVQLGDSSSLEIGQRVLAIGNPFGYRRTLTTGIVSSLGRTIPTESGRTIADAIQTDAPINPGNSGGPLLDTAGRLVGLNTAIVSRSGESSGVGFAIPVNLVKRSVPDLMRFGRVLRPKIGVALEDTELGWPVVDYVLPGSPADKAGLSGVRRKVQMGTVVRTLIDVTQGDFILGVNGREVRTKDEVLEEISKTKEGESLELSVRRGTRASKVRKVTVKPELG